MSEYKDFEVGQRVKANSLYGEFYGDPNGTVVNIDPEGTCWPIEVKMDDEYNWGQFNAPFNPEELDIV